jgi:DNA-binding CsgD family transcriptional regulator
VRAFRVLCGLESGDDAAVRTAFAMTCAEELNNPVTPLRALTLLAESCVTLRDVERAELLYTRLLPYASQNVVCSSTDYTGGSVSYYLGLLATLLDRPPAAGQHFEHAVWMNDRWGVRVYSGHARFAWAELLWKYGGREDHGKVTRLLGEARRIAEDIGSVRLLKKVTDLEKQVSNVPPGVVALDASSDKHELSRREREVLALIVSGLTDKEIAEQLFISPRTVSTHVTHILNKLGVHSRMDAARVVSSNGRYPNT